MTRVLGTKLIAALAVMGLGLPAMADGFAFDFNYGRHYHRHHGVAVGVAVGVSTVIAPAPVVVTPAPVVVPVRPVWIAPVYSTVADRVWVPTVATAYRDVPVVDRWGRVVSYRREPYTVRSGYWSTMTKRVLVRQGYWTTGVGTQVAVTVVPRGGGPEVVEPDAVTQPDDGAAQPESDYGNIDYGRPAVPGGYQPDPRTYRSTGGAAGAKVSATR